MAKESFSLKMPRNNRERGAAGIHEFFMYEPDPPNDICEKQDRANRLIIANMWFYILRFDYSGDEDFSQYAEKKARSVEARSKEVAKYIRSLIPVLNSET